jgi:hypothetical protein
VEFNELMGDDIVAGCHAHSILFGLIEVVAHYKNRPGLRCVGEVNGKPPASKRWRRIVRAWKFARAGRSQSPAGQRADEGEGRQ